jgi:phage tail sheath protein FI
MPEYLAPGVYVEEVPSGIKPIEGVSTSTAGFLGVTERGPESPQFITSWLDYQRWYGGYVPDKSYLAYAVQGFFDNGGQRCFVGRVINDEAIAAQGDIVTTGTEILKAAAIGRGAWGNDVTIEVSEATQRSDWVQVTVQYGDILETYDNLTHEIGPSNGVVATVNGVSRVVRLWWDGDTTAPLAAQTVQLADGDDGGAITPAEFQGDLDPIPLDLAPDPPLLPPDDLLGRGRGLAALETIDEISLLIVPDEVRTDMGPITQSVISQCELLKDRFAIISALQSAGPVQGLRPPRDSSYAGFYYPWIKVYDPTINGLRLIPPTGHIAGIFARTDIERGVHKAPANAVVRGAADLQLPVKKADQDILNPRGVNCIRDFRSDGRGIRLWGARTSTSDPEWKYVNVRRLFLFVEESIDEGTQWVVFEPNHEPTWAAVRRNITNFLISVWRSGALMGVTQDEAFFVKCDRTTMTQDDIDNGRLICYIGIAPVKPAEFVIFRISQKTVEASS